MGGSFFISFVFEIVVDNDDDDDDFEFDVPFAFVVAEIVPVFEDCMNCGKLIEGKEVDIVVAVDLDLEIDKVEEEEVEEEEDNKYVDCVVVKFLVVLFVFDGEFKG